MSFDHWMSEADLIKIKEAANAGSPTDPETVVRLVDQARYLDHVTQLIASQRLQDVEALLDHVRDRLGNEHPLYAVVKRGADYVSSLVGMAVKYKDGWPSAHVDLTKTK
jgi:hypothetical protein